MKPGAASRGREALGTSDWDTLGGLPLGSGFTVASSPALLVCKTEVLLQDRLQTAPHLLKLWFPIWVPHGLYLTIGKYHKYVPLCLLQCPSLVRIKSVWGKKKTVFFHNEKNEFFLIPFKF